jgi:ABC-2 type transport system ATP-binding protein
MEASIEVSGLRKRYGSTVALDGLSFTVRAGQVPGFVGPNGAGKSTTMRVILGLTRPTRAPHSSGAALPKAAPPFAMLVRCSTRAVHPARTGRNHLLWLAHSQGLTARRVDALLTQVGLETAGRRKAGGYSLGMRQRLGLAAAMLGDPPVLMLDEPFNGLDPEGIVWMRGFLRGLG